MFTFVVIRTGTLAGTSTVQYATQDGTATVAGGDYQSASGTLVFAPGETSNQISVIVFGDSEFEPNESFGVNLSSPTNAIIDNGAGVGTIVNDDSPVTTTPTPTPTPVFEGDINGDNNVTVTDEQLLLSYLRGAACPRVDRHQASDVGPLRDASGNLMQGDGLLGSADATVMSGYVAQVAGGPFDFDPNTPGFQFPPAGGPATITNLTCTPPASAMEDANESSASAEFDTTSFRIVSASGYRNGEVTVEIEMTSDGNEAGTQFSLHFDPTRFSISDVSGIGQNPDVAVGAGVDLATTTVNVNADEVALGHIGLAFNFNATNQTTTLPAGTSRIVSLTFRVLSNAPFGASGIVFTHESLLRETATLNGKTKTATYANGILTVKPASRNIELPGRVTTPLMLSIGGFISDAGSIALVEIPF
jgi:hypothetical protein